MTMNRITGHHAASGYTPSKEALKAYHRVINGDGEVIAGNHSISDNAPGRPLTPGTYAAHTWKLNSGNIGVAILAMRNAQWANPSGGTNPVLLRQVDAYCKEVATLAIDYNITSDRRFILTHAEVQPTLGVTQKNKWDFDYDPRYRSKSRDPIAIGDELRQEISRIMQGIKGGGYGSIPAPAPPTPEQQIVLQFPTLRQGATGDYVVKLQERLRALGYGSIAQIPMKIDGVFGPRTRDAVIAYQRRSELLPDGVVGRMTWASLETASNRKPK